MTLLARKRMVYAGRELAAGDILDPAPEGRLQKVLLDQGRIFRVVPTEGTVFGTGYLGVTEQTVARVTDDGYWCECGKGGPDGNGRFATPANLARHQDRVHGRA